MLKCEILFRNQNFKSKYTYASVLSCITESRHVIHILVIKRVANIEDFARRQRVEGGNPATHQYVLEGV